jgi:hypothetical protein
MGLTFVGGSTGSTFRDGVTSLVGEMAVSTEELGIVFWPASTTAASVVLAETGSGTSSEPTPLAARRCCLFDVTGWNPCRPLVTCAMPIFQRNEISTKATQSTTRKFFLFLQGTKESESWWM